MKIFKSIIEVIAYIVSTFLGTQLVMISFLIIGFELSPMIKFLSAVLAHGVIFGVFYYPLDNKN